MRVNLGSDVLVFEDNIATVELAAADPQAAIDDASTLVRRIFRQLAQRQGRAFTATPRLFLGPSGGGGTIDEGVSLRNAVGYELTQLADDIRAAAADAGVEDSRLVRALQYHEHALYLLDNAERIAGIGSPHFEYLFSSIILNLWKSVSAIVGEPGERDYQSRYMRFGIAREYFQAEIDGTLKDLRNDRDVAHYEPTEDEITQLKGPAVTKALAVAREVIERYRTFLRT